MKGLEMIKLVAKYIPALITALDPIVPEKYRPLVRIVISITLGILAMYLGGSVAGLVGVL